VWYVDYVNPNDLIRPFLHLILEHSKGIFIILYYLPYGLEQSTYTFKNPLTGFVDNIIASPFPNS